MRSENYFRWVATNGASFFVCLVLMFFLSACSGKTKEKEAEILFAEINEISSRKEGSVSEIPDNIRNDLNQKNIDRFPISRQTLETAAKQAIPYYETDYRRFAEIVARYETMEKLDLNPRYMESVSIQKQRFQSYAKAMELQKERLMLLYDETITDHESLMQRSRAIETQLDEIAKQIKDLEERSKKDNFDVTNSSDRR